MIVLLLACVSAPHLEQQGRAALDAHDLPEARRLFEQAVEKDPTLVDAWDGLGWARLTQQDDLGAQEAFVMCASLAPNEPRCLRGQASIQMRAGNLDGAEALLNKARDTHPDNLEVKASLGLLALARGETKVAESIYEDLTTQAPDVPSIQLGHAKVLCRKNKWEACIEALDHALALPDLKVRYKAALLEQKARAILGTTGAPLTVERCTDDLVTLHETVDKAEATLHEAVATTVAIPSHEKLLQTMAKQKRRFDKRCAVLFDRRGAIDVEEGDAQSHDD